MEIKKISDQVEHILQKYPDTRNSDIRLTIMIWLVFNKDKVVEYQNGEMAIPLRNLFEVPREDHIKRIRAKFNSQGKYLPTIWEVAKQRGILEDVWKKSLGYNV